MASCNYADAAGGAAGAVDWAFQPATIAGLSTITSCDLPPPTRRTLPACPELDCIRHLLPPGLIAAAELRAAEVGVGADRALIAADIVSEGAYLAALSAEGLAFEPLDDLPRAAIPLPDERLIEAAAVGILPLTVAGDVEFVIALRGFAARTLVAALSSGSDLARRMRITSSERMQKFIARHGAKTLSRRATNALRTARPELSAGSRNKLSISLMLLMMAIALFLIFAPRLTLMIGQVMLGAIFLGWVGLRIASLLSRRCPVHRRMNLADDRLPVYTIVIALYQEAAAVKNLVAALRRLDYPKEKLDIKLVLEADDRETRARLEAMRLGAPFELVIAPTAGPRTKPKALNAALPSARGALIAVYDAEDRPEPDQLRRALEAFATGDHRLACAQARLTIDNTADSWLTRLFTAEYAGLFDVFLPNLAAWRLPLPLGGSSNHFRTDVLRRIGAWDPYNVTEDADLGMRLARFGYRTTVIASSTYEEAPARLQPWIKQRTRWFKGWLQTWLVHMRSPRKLWRELGPRGFVVFQLLAGGSALAALVHPLFVFEFIRAVIISGDDPTASVSASLHGTMLALAYFASGVLALCGLARRKLLKCAWALLLMPAYWLLLSLAAWRALYQLVRDPYRWEKTEHGLAKNSRLREEGEAVTANIKNIASGRRPRPRGDV